MRRAATTTCLSALLFAVFAQACRPGAAVPGDAGTTTTTTSPVVVDAAGGSCHTSAECPAKQACFYKEAGCSELGRCAPAEGAPSSTCYVAIAMCSCVDHRTFYGAGGCAGQGVTEPWELYACPCTTDADCHAGQKCVATDAKPHRAGAARECRDPAPAR